MSPELLPIDRKDILKVTTSFSSEPVEKFPACWRESSTTPSHPKNLWSGGGCGPSDFRRPFTGPRVSVDLGNQKDSKGGHSWETTASPNGNFNRQTDFVNSWDQLHSNDQKAKNSSPVSFTGGQRLEKGNSLGSTLDWKPIKWIRSGSLSSRGASFSHSSSCKIIGVETLDSKTDPLQPGNNTLVRSPSADTAPCLTPTTPDEANSRKKARLGWGEGLAKYEKKKVDPNDVVDKETGPRDGTIDDASISEPLVSSPSNLPAKSPNVAGYLECASPTTSCSFACSSSPGVEERTSVTEATLHTDTRNHSHACQNHTQELTFNLENLELPEGFNMSSLLDELLQTDETSGPGSRFAMDKLQVWKADISRSLEITESEIDSLEIELKSLKSDRGSCPISSSSRFLLKECNNKNIQNIEITGASTSILEKTECSQDHVGTDMVTFCGDSSKVSTFSVDDVQEKLYKSILASNIVKAKETSDEISKMLPTRVRTGISRATDNSLMAEKFVMRKRFLKFKERIISLKFRALHYYWKKDLCLLFSRKSGSKPNRKSESSFRMGFADHQRHRSSIYTRLSSPAGNLCLVPTKEMVEYANKLLYDSQIIRASRNAQKMPTFVLDKGTRTSTRFISDNGLVENPIDVEKEKSIVKAWTVEDKETFLEKYSCFGKNFRKIATFLPNKTVADCVEFYYKNHKSDDFQKTKQSSEFAKGKSKIANTYLVTSGKQRPNRETRAMVYDANGGCSILKQSNGSDSFCSEQETAAADVLAGICGSISPEALGSCVTSLVDHGDVLQKVKRCQKQGGSSSSLRCVDDETCSDDSCGEDMDSSHWTDEEKSSFMKAVRTYGKDFSMISQCVRTRSIGQCSVYFSKTKNVFGLDTIANQGSSEGTTGANQGDHDDTCMIDSGSGISQDKSSMEFRMDVDDRDSSDTNVVNNCTEPALMFENSIEQVPKLNVNLEGAADSEATEAVNVEPSPQTANSDSASGAKVEEADPVVNGSANDLSVTYYSRAGLLDLSIDDGSKLDLNAVSENVTCREIGNDFVTTSLFPKNLDRKTVVSQDDVSSKLSFRKSGQRSSSIDGYHLCCSPRRSLSCNEPQSNFKFDESLLMPRDGCIQMCPNSTTVSQEQRRCSSLDIEKASSNGDVKLFGQILTNTKANGSATGNSSNSKFENSGAHRKLASLDLDKDNDSAFGAEKNLQLNRSYGFWDGNRIQTGLSSLPDSAVLLAKYPSAFSDINVTSGFSSRKLSNNNRGPSYHPYGQSFTVDKVLSEIPRRKELEAALSTTSVQQGRGLKGVGGASCNGVADPVAAIRMHYAKTEHYKNGGIMEKY